MAMDAEPVARETRGDDGRRDPGDLGRQGPAIRVAKDDPARACGVGGLEAGERVTGVRLPAVEEVLGIEKRLPAFGNNMFDGCPDVVDVLLERDAERLGHVEVVGLADEADGGRAGVEHGGEHVVVRGRAPCALRHAEGGQRGAGLRRVGEEFGIGGICARPAALDVVDPERVEGERDAALLLGRELHPLRLLPVAERGVKEVEAVAGHGRASHGRYMGNLWVSYGCAPALASARQPRSVQRDIIPCPPARRGRPLPRFPRPNRRGCRSRGCRPA
jgi:hypothetical protein